MILVLKPQRLLNKTLLVTMLRIFHCLYYWEKNPGGRKEVTWEIENTTNGRFWPYEDFNPTASPSSLCSWSPALLYLVLEVTLRRHRGRSPPPAPGNAPGRAVNPVPCARVLTCAFAGNGYIAFKNLWKGLGSAKVNSDFPGRSRLLQLIQNFILCRVLRQDSAVTHWRAKQSILR